MTTKRSADGGIDGRVYFAVPHAQDLQSMVVEVKGGANVSIRDLRALKGVLDYDTALMAGLIIMEPLGTVKARNFAPVSWLAPVQLGDTRNRVSEDAAFDGRGDPRRASDSRHLRYRAVTNWSRGCQGFQQSGCRTAVKERQMLMNDKQLDRTLRSIGKACFVNHFTELSDLSLSDEAVAQILAEREKWDEFATLSFRVRGARRIIEACRDQDALRVDSGLTEDAGTQISGLSTT